MPKPPNGAEPSAPVMSFEPKVLNEPDGPRLALSTGLDGTQAWFVYIGRQGGYYTDGVLEELEYWQPMILDTSWEAPARPDPEEDAS